jgi:mono/diheme cytochrome c family protein
VTSARRGRRNSLLACLWLASLAAVALAASGCPGNGSALGGGGIGGIEPTLPSIQEHVFGAICINCHVPGGAGSFMLLDTAEHAYQNLVDVPSLEDPSLDRVEPGDPEASYIVHKIEGRATIQGDPMPPPPETRLTPEEIAAIREWIENGAEP